MHVVSFTFIIIIILLLLRLTPFDVVLYVFFIPVRK